jgi:hypothetical protein
LFKRALVATNVLIASMEDIGSNSRACCANIYFISPKTKCVSV